MDYAIELKFQQLCKKLEKDFEMNLDVQSLLFLIGVNELGAGAQNYTKQQKTDLMHVALCTILEPYGFYRFTETDEDNWPHFELVNQLPSLNHNEQQHLIKEAMLSYFVANNYINEEDLQTSL